MNLHKFKLKELKIKYQEKWENAYLIFKNARDSIGIGSLCLPNFALLRQQNIEKLFRGIP